MALRFDTASLQTQGNPFPLGDDVALVASNGFADLTASGTTVMYAGGGDTRSNLVWLDRGGNQVSRIDAAPQLYTALRLAPGGRRAVAGVMQSRSGARSLVLLDFAAGMQTELTVGELCDDPVWSPDGSEIVYQVIGKGLFKRSTVNATANVQVLQATQRVRPTSWSANGRWLLYSNFDEHLRPQLWVLPMDGSGASYPYARMATRVSNGVFAPNSRWVAYDSSETGRSEVYIQSFPSGLGRWQISTEGGESPRWREDGQEIYYSNAGSLMSVALSAQGTGLRAAAPRRLFANAGLFIGNIRFEPAANGTRFLVGDSGKKENKPLTVLLNWQDSMK